MFFMLWLAINTWYLLKFNNASCRNHRLTIKDHLEKCPEWESSRRKYIHSNIFGRTSELPQGGGIVRGCLGWWEKNRIEQEVNSSIL